MATKELPTIKIKITGLTYTDVETIEIELSGATAALRKKIKTEIIKAVEVLTGEKIV
jgi:hypothetical protein